MKSGEMKKHETNEIKPHQQEEIRTWYHFLMNNAVRTSAVEIL
jgi:hypothetical protein